MRDLFRIIEAYFQDRSLANYSDDALWQATKTLRSVADWAERQRIDRRRN
jgi:hypothetical protein